MRVMGSTSTLTGLAIWLRPVPNVDEVRFVWPRTFEAGPPGDGRHAGEGTAPTTTPTSSATTTTTSACTTTCLFVQIRERERERERRKRVEKGRQPTPRCFFFSFCCCWWCCELAWFVVVVVVVGGEEENEKRKPPTKTKTLGAQTEWQVLLACFPKYEDDQAKTKEI